MEMHATPLRCQRRHAFQRHGAVGESTEPWDVEEEGLVQSSSSTSNRRHHDDEGSDGGTMSASSSVPITPPPAAAEYGNPSSRRKLADATTVKERLRFQRDYRYGKRRPLPQLPWQYMKKKTYMDDAERLHGRLETWPTFFATPLQLPSGRGEMDEQIGADAFVDSFGHRVDPQQLETLLIGYLKDLHAQIRVETKRAERFASLCEGYRSSYMSYMEAGGDAPQVLRAWGAELLAKQRRTATLEDSSRDDTGITEDGTSTATTTFSSSATDAGDMTSASPESERTARAFFEAEERRQQGARVQLEGTPAFGDLHPDDATVDPRGSDSAFPFLRQRAVSAAGKGTLDPSLVDWSAKYFPDDAEEQFEEPAELQTSVKVMAARASDRSSSADRGEERISDTGAEDDSKATRGLRSETSPRKGGEGGSARTKRTKRFGKHRLHRSLTSLMDRASATYDAEGAFFRVRPMREEDGDGSHAAKPTKPLKASAFATASTPSVKVDWETITTARSTRKTPEVHRAKERLIRLTRGEAPDGVPR